LRRGRLWLVLPLVEASWGLIVAATREDGFTARSVDLGAGSVWVSSTGPGQLALLDGASAGVTVQLAVAAGGDDLIAVQGNGAGFGVNRTTGEVIRADAATWHTTSTRLLDASAAGLAAVAGENALYVTDVQRGLVARADPATLAPMGGQLSLSAARGTGVPVVDRQGTLWLIDTASGDLIRMQDTPQRTEASVAHGIRSRLVLVQGEPVVVDPASRTAVRIDPDSGTPTGDIGCLDVDPSDMTVTVTGTANDPRVYLVSGRDGLLHVSDLDSGECSQVLSIAEPGSDLGDPVEVAGRVFVPDRSTGRVIVVDPAARTSLTTQPVVSAAAPFQLIGRDGFAFYNDPTSNQAGVVEVDGSVRTIPKYNADEPGKGVYQPPDSAPEPASAPPPMPPSSSAEATPIPGPVLPATETPTGTPPSAVPPTVEAAADPAEASPPASIPPPAPIPSPTPTPTVPGPISISPPAVPPEPDTGSPSPSPSSLSPTPTPTATTSPTPAPKRRVTVTVTGSGTVDAPAQGLSCSAICEFDVDDGADLTVTAGPGSGQQLINWTGPCTGADPTCTFVASQDVALGANFDTSSVLLSVQITAGQGQVFTNGSAFCSMGTCGRSLPRAVPITLTATPAIGYRFTGWTGGGCTGMDPCVVPMTGATQVQATFAQIDTLTVTTPTGGRITGGGIECGTICSVTFSEPTAVVLTVAPDEDKSFAGWTGGCSGTAPTCSITVTGSTAVAVTFADFPMGPFVGDWVQNDGQGSERAIIRSTTPFAGTFEYFGDCVPTDCDWGPRSASISGNSLTCVVTESFVIRQVAITRTGDLLTIRMDNHYIDSSGRADSTWIHTYARTG
jgi:hypothetical protein